MISWVYVRRKISVERYIEKEISQKPIFSLKNISFLIFHLIILGIIIASLFKFGKMSVGNLNKLSIINIASAQTSISLLSITVMQLILPDRKEKIFEVTYQNILFKWKVFKYFNVLDCTMYMLILMVTNISLSIASIIITSMTIQIICKVIFLVVLFESFSLAIYMIYLGLISKFKISRIYYLIYKKMRKGNSDVYNMILKGIRNTLESENEENKSKEYIKVEIAILEYMSNYIDKFDLFTYKDTVNKIINEEKKE